MSCGWTGGAAVTATAWTVAAGGGTRACLRGGRPAVVDDHYNLTSLKATLRRGEPGALLAHARRPWENENGRAPRQGPHDE